MRICKDKYRGTYFYFLQNDHGLTASCQGKMYYKSIQKIFEKYNDLDLIYSKCIIESEFDVILYVKEENLNIEFFKENFPEYMI